jgi:quercetin dioxygenase-like cupin family protein
VKRVVIGEGPDGRSKVVSASDPPRTWRYVTSSEVAPHHNRRTLTTEPFAAPGPLGAWVAELWATREDGVSVAGEDPGEYTDLPGVHSLEVPAGVTRFSVINFGAGYESKMHSTDSIDFDVCLAGELDLVVESGVVRLEPGDVAIVPGSRHAWRTATGATFAFVMISPHATNGTEHHGEQ